MGMKLSGSLNLTGSINCSGSINGANNLVTTASFNNYTSSYMPTAIVRSNNPILINSQTPIIVTDMTVAPDAGTYIINFNSQFTVDNTSNETLEAAEALQTLYDELMALSATETGHAATYGSETLSPGIYTQAGAATITGDLTLDGGGDTASLFVFRQNGALTISAAAQVLLTNGAQSNNVWFVSEGASSTGANSIISGSIISNQAAVSTGADTKIQGRMLAINGAASVGATSIFTEPIGNSVSTLGSLDLFNIFCATGSITNTGASEIELSVGTNDGTITGFGTAIVGGSLIAGGSVNLTIFRCGVYVDGVIIDDSLRSTSRPFAAETFEFPIILQTVATINEGQVIDIRGYSELGIQTIGPQMSLVITPITT
jgi:hypothetical protein